MLASVTPCPEPQAASNQCGPDSLIGHSIATAGLGPEPVTLPGQVYLTGPYEGAPFGIAVVTPAVAGPFNLGDVTVRSQINVDPSTAAVSIQSDPFPTFVKGVPAQIKALSVSDRPPELPVQPDQLRPEADHRHDHRRSRRQQSPPRAPSRSRTARACPSTRPSPPQPRATPPKQTAPPSRSRSPPLQGRRTSPKRSCSSRSPCRRA